MSDETYVYRIIINNSLAKMAQIKMECRNLSFSRGDRTIIDQFNLELAAGDVAVFQGSNGAGKTTLIKLLSGIVKASSGAINYNDMPINASECYSKQMLYIGHKLALQDSLSVADNISFWADLSGHPELVAPAIEYFDLKPFLDMPISTLSAGWKKRVALTRLITIPCKLWLLDEPTSNLDDDGIALFESLCSARREQGGIILMALHGAVSDEHVKIININS